MFKNTSLPKVLSQDTLDFLDIDAVLESPKPATTELQKVVLDGAIQDELGNWVQTWKIIDKYQEILNEDGVVVTTAQEQIDSYLDSLRIVARERLKACRDAIIQSPINNFQVATAEDRENIQGYLQYEVAEPLEWIMADNTIQLVYLSDLQAVIGLYIQRKLAAYDAFNSAVRALGFAASRADIDAIYVEIVE